MSAQPDEVIRHWFDEVWNQGHEAAIDRLLAADAVLKGTPGGARVGSAGFLPFLHAFRGAFPDLHIEIERTITQGELVAAYCRVTGTHTGSAIFGLPSTGRRIEMHGVTMARIVDGKVREGWNCYDMLTLYQQLGLVASVLGT